MIIGQGLSAGDYEFQFDGAESALLIVTASAYGYVQLHWEDDFGNWQLGLGSQTSDGVYSFNGPPETWKLTVGAGTTNVNAAVRKVPS